MWEVDKARIARVGLALLVAMLGGCAATHVYTLPTVAAIQTGPDQTEDVAWVIEDGIHIVRCVRGQERPLCRRASVE